VGEAVVSVSGCQRKLRGAGIAGVVARLRPALWRRGCVLRRDNDPIIAILWSVSEEGEE